MSVTGQKYDTKSGVRKVIITTAPQLHPFSKAHNATQNYFCRAFDMNGFQYEIDLQAMPPGVRWQQIQPNQVWWIEKRTSLYRLYLYAGEYDPTTRTIDSTEVLETYPLYVNIYSTQTQTATNANTIYKATFDQTSDMQGFTIVSGTNIVAQEESTYNFNFSAQLYAATVGGTAIANVAIWLQVNGKTSPWPGGIISLSAKNPYAVAGWNYITYMNEGDYATLVWETDTAGTQVLASASPIIGPQTPSWAFTATQI